MVPFGGNIRSHFDEFDRMADRMMANFGMPKMDISKTQVLIDYLQQ